MFDHHPGSYDKVSLDTEAQVAHGAHPSTVQAANSM